MADEKKPKKRTGRPRVELNEAALKAAAAIGATEDEIVAAQIANGVQLDVRTLKRRLKETHYRDIWDNARAQFKLSLRRLQFRHAQMANSAGVTMTIHMAKFHLGETEKSLIDGLENGGSLSFVISKSDAKL